MVVRNPFSFDQFLGEDHWNNSQTAQLSTIFKTEAMTLPTSPSFDPTEPYIWSVAWLQGSETFRKGPEWPWVAQTQNGIGASVIMV